MGQDRKMQMIGGNGGNQSRQYAGQNAGNLNGYNAIQNVANQIAKNPRVQNNLAVEVEKVNSVNRKLKETNADLTTELARY
nr:hypothetical protein [Tanacetum cinerariifolium]